MSNTPLRIATRRSKLAMWQAEHVQSLLRAAHPELPVELVPMSTQGDRVLDRALAEVGGKGLFVKELEVAMQEGRADIAVHSMKDVPSELPPGFAIVAVLPRANPLDAFISRRFKRFEDLPHGARVGTSSPRRQAQLRHARPDLRLELLRGNVDTRLRRLDEGELDAILLACAGTRASRHRPPHHAAARHRAVVAGRGPGSDRHRESCGRPAQSRRAGSAASCRFVHAARGGALVRRHARRQLSFADRGPCHARRRHADRARFHRRARRQRNLS